MNRISPAREKLIKLLVSQKVGYVVAGHKNSILDGQATKLPSRDNLTNEIYNEVINEKMLEVGDYLIPIQKDIRFYGKKNIMNLINIKLVKNINNSEFECETII